MDRPTKRRFQFGMKSLLCAVAIVGGSMYFRPGQLHPADVPVGKSKAWVKWYCGDPVNEGIGYWDYCPSPYDRWICVLFEGDDYDRVEKVVKIRKLPYVPK